MNALTPYLPSHQAGKYQDLLKSLELLHVSSDSLCRGVHPSVLSEVIKSIDLVNNYYSNLIESEGTHPVDITRAMRKDFSSNTEKASRQRLALAYQDTQRFVCNTLPEFDFADSEHIKSIHKHFYGSKALLEEQLFIKDERGNKHKVIPGCFRDMDVQIGDHFAPKTCELPRLFNDFYKHYKHDKNDLVVHKLLKAFAAHHRYMFIHPFLDGNGRTGRLMTDGMLKQALPESYGLWSLSRGLARENAEYKQFLARADQVRQGSTDGRGMRSESGLMAFLVFMTKVALDQVTYMEGMLKLDRLYNRLTKYIVYSEAPIPPEFEKLLPQFLIMGEIKKANLPEVLGCSERKARNVAKVLKSCGLIQDEGKRSAPYKLQFTSKMLSYVFPDLIPAVKIKE